MLTVKKTYTYEKYFSEDVLFSDALKLVVYIQSFYDQRKLGFIKRKFYTKIINLSDEEQIFKDFKPNTRNEIRRAIKEGTLFEIEDNIESFIDFYNDFSKAKGLYNISFHDINRFNQNIIITKAVNKEGVLAMHSYIIDNEIKHVRLLHSSTSIKIDNKSLVGRANRFLHFKDMMYFMNSGFNQYDLGGYALNTKDISLKNINNFKDSFGGELIENSNFFPVFYIIASKLKKIIKW